MRYSSSIEPAVLLSQGTRQTAHFTPHCYYCMFTSAGISVIQLQLIFHSGSQAIRYSIMQYLHNDKNQTTCHFKLDVLITSRLSCTCERFKSFKHLLYQEVNISSVLKLLTPMLLTLSVVYYNILHCSHKLFNTHTNSHTLTTTTSD